MSEPLPGSTEFSSEFSTPKIVLAALTAEVGSATGAGAGSSTSTGAGAAEATPLPNVSAPTVASASPTPAVTRVSGVRDRGFVRVFRDIRILLTLEPQKVVSTQKSLW
ncbi:hypothetical protein BST37_05280 [Mycobacterium noviomagense]|uniref:Uncharacterized protein n=1 Tax=Mycobacterium noviomagense TaxID=459858 RepID=A0ABX3T8W8_9MYCO|nr:hypothetical protein BST37_05280 [Mycobacterium noviomagense]